MEIYAEISSKMLKEIEDGNDLVLPSGVTISRKKGSRVCNFECDEISKQDMVEFLDDNQISWQELTEEKEVKKGKKNKWEKPAKRKGGFREIPDSLNEDN
jgi:hypothetical protein